QKPWKSKRWAALMLGTTRPREPSGRGMSMARPKFTSSRRSITGLPLSSTSKPLFMSVISVMASTIAHPIRWVEETLPARLRLRWLLMTMRLSNSSLTGTSRTEVAVGTVSDSSMLRTTAFAGPRSLTTSGSCSSTAGICAVVVGTFAGRSEVVETLGVLGSGREGAAGSWSAWAGASFTDEDSFAGGVDGVRAGGGAWSADGDSCAGGVAAVRAAVDGDWEAGAAEASACPGSRSGAGAGSGSEAASGGPEGSSAVLSGVGVEELEAKYSAQLGS